MAWFSKKKKKKREKIFLFAKIVAGCTYNKNWPDFLKDFSFMHSLAGKNNIYIKITLINSQPNANQWPPPTPPPTFKINFFFSLTKIFILSRFFPSFFFCGQFETSLFKFLSAFKTLIASAKIWLHFLYFLRVENTFYKKENNFLCFLFSCFAK